MDLSLDVRTLPYFWGMFRFCPPPTNNLIGCAKGATDFALRNGIEAKDTLTDDARKQFEEWRAQHAKDTAASEASQGESHDTVGVVCLDDQGNLCAGT